MKIIDWGRKVIIRYSMNWLSRNYWKFLDFMDFDQAEKYGIEDVIITTHTRMDVSLLKDDIAIIIKKHKN